MVTLPFSLSILLLHTLLKTLSLGGSDLNRFTPDTYKFSIDSKERTYVIIQAEPKDKNIVYLYLYVIFFKYLFLDLSWEN